MKAWLMGVAGLCTLAITAVDAQDVPRIQEKLKRQTEVHCIGKDVTTLQEKIEKLPSGALRSIATDEIKMARALMASGDPVGCTLRLRAALNAVEEHGALLLPP